MILIKIFVQNISRFNQVSLFGNLDSSICHSILCYSLLIYASLICIYPPCLISSLSYGISSLSIYYVSLPYDKLLSLSHFSLYVTSSPLSIFTLTPPYITSFSISLNITSFPLSLFLYIGPSLSKLPSLILILH